MVARAYQIEPSLFKVHKTEQYLHLSLNEPYSVLSSAELNGGFVTSQHFLNYRVVSCPFEDDTHTHPRSPAESLLGFAGSHSLPKSTVGMMTAASMNSFRMATVQIDTVRITLALTCGLSNARCAGDQADYPYLFESSQTDGPLSPLGTINTFVAINHPMQPKALVEAHSLIAEARATTLQRLGIKSEVSSELATGTGTDSTAIACLSVNEAILAARSPPIVPIDYCGKHVILAEVMAKLMIACLTASINREAVKAVL